MEKKGLDVFLKLRYNVRLLSNIDAGMMSMRIRQERDDVLFQAFPSAIGPTGNSPQQRRERPGSFLSSRDRLSAYPGSLSAIRRASNAAPRLGAGGREPPN